MRRSLAILLLVLANVLSAQANAAEICDRIDYFVKAQLADPNRTHWVEMHWGYDPTPGTIWSKACRNSNDNPSKEFCNWLFAHSSWEFRFNLPISILECYGYRFPKTAVRDWAVFDGEFQPEHSDAVWLKMESATKGLRETESALRLSVSDIDPATSFDADNLPAIEPFPLEEATG